MTIKSFLLRFHHVNGLLFYSLTLFLEVPLRIVTLKSNVTKYNFGQSVGLTCEALSYPLSAITWTKNDVGIVNGNNYNISQIPGNSYYQTISVLSFTIQYLNDRGTYSCIATQLVTGKVVKSNPIQASKFLFLNIAATWNFRTRFNRNKAIIFISYLLSCNRISTHTLTV